MKKYLMTGIAVLAFASCTTHDFETMSQEQFVKAEYEAKFIAEFGKPGANQDWGFGSSTRAFTRATDLLKSQFTLPEFRDKDDITEPTWPGLPATLDGKAIYTTWQQVKDAKIPCADDVEWNNGWDNVYTAYIDADHTNIRSDRSAGRTYYVNGDVKYWNGVSADGATFIVLEGSTLHLGSINHNIKIYLCRNATVDFTKTWEVTTDYSQPWPFPTTTTEKDVEGVTLEKSNAAIYMNEGSNVKAKTLEVFDGANIYNDGGTIEASYLYLHKNSNLYNNGGKVKVDDGKIYAFDGCKVLVDNGCEVTADQMDIDKNTTLWNKGSITVTKDIQGANENAFIYNAANKTIMAASIDLINNSDLLVNDGTVEVTNGGSITLQNSGAEIVNNANMSCGSFSMAAGAKMFNVGNMTMTGKTFINNSNSGWQNEGVWECGSMEITGDDKTAGNVFNNCRLTVKGLFDLNRGSFILDSYAGVDCESFRIDDTSGFYFGNKSVLDISGTLTTSIINPEYGFFTYGSEYAVVKANSIVTTTNDEQSINYYGKLLVAINPHLSEDYYTAEESVLFTAKGDDIATIPSDKCNPGYEGKTVTYQGRIMAEDLSVNSRSDWDFNDVVFDWAIEGGKAYIKLLAAGGTLPLTIGGELINGEVVGGVEIHNEVNGLKGYMKNCGVGDEVPATEFVLQGDHNTYADNDANAIKLHVLKGGKWIEITAEKGEPAGKFNCEVGTKWCEEFANITWVYSSFAAWVENEKVSWAVNPVEEYVDYKNVNDNKEKAKEAN